jgi:hypothetical protein
MNAQAQTTDEPVRQPPNQMLKPRDHVSWSTMASFFFFFAFWKEKIQQI